MKLDLLTQKESERLMEYYWSQAAPYTYITVLEGARLLPVFILKHKNDLVVEEDNSVAWQVREIGLGLHSFIEIITGEKRKKRVYLPLCLVRP